MQMGRWTRANDTAITNNRFVVGGLDRTPGSVSLFLVCLEPEAVATGSVIGQLRLHLGRLWPPVLQSLPESGYVYVSWDAPPTLRLPTIAFTVAKCRPSRTQ